MTHREKAMNNFLEGYNCAQAVIIAFSEELGLDKDTAAMLSCSFGGGMGQMRETCGAVTGMALVAGSLGHAVAVGGYLQRVVAADELDEAGEAVGLGRLVGEALESVDSMHGFLS